MAARRATLSARRAPNQHLTGILIGILASAFFAVTFVVNRKLATHGGAWEWTSSLRYFYVGPMLLLVVGARRGIASVVGELRTRPGPWLLWSTIGFVLFYAPITYAANSSPAWVVAAVWQLTIVAGMLLAPLLYEDHRRRIPVSSLLLSLAILVGVALVEFNNFRHAHSTSGLVAGLAAVLVAACSYPAGNRRTLRLAAGRLDTWQRLLAMSLASLPAWAVIAVIGALRTGAATADQLRGTFVTALSSGVVATALFFTATARTHHDPRSIAAVEATQAAEVPFTVLGEKLLPGATWPGPQGWVGIVIICLGVAGHALKRDAAPLDAG